MKEVIATFLLIFLTFYRLAAQNTTRAPAPDTVDIMEPAISSNRPSYQAHSSVRIFYPLAIADYALKEEDNYINFLNSHAGFGVGVGFNHVMPIFSSLGFLVGGDLFVNTMGSERREELIEHLKTESQSADLKRPVYFNFPIKAGLEKTVRIGGRDFLLVRAQKVFNIHKRTPMKATFDDDSNDWTYSFGTSKGYLAGVAIQLKESIYLGIDLMDLGGSKMKVKEISTISGERRISTYNYQQEISVIAISVEIRDFSTSIKQIF